MNNLIYYSLIDNLRNEFLSQYFRTLKKYKYIRQNSPNAEILYIYLINKANDRFRVDITYKEIQEELGFDKSKTSRLLSNLEKWGLIYRFTKLEDTNRKEIVLVAWFIYDLNQYKNFHHVFVNRRASALDDINITTPYIAIDFHIDFTIRKA